MLVPVEAEKENRKRKQIKKTVGIFCKLQTLDRWPHRKKGLYRKKNRTGKRCIPEKWPYSRKDSKIY